MPLATKIIQTKTNQVWTTGDNIVPFADPFNDTLYDFIASAPGITINVTGPKTTTSIHINCSGPTSEGYYIGIGDPAPTTFFNPDVANSGWQKVSSVVQLLDNSNRVFVGVASSDIPSLRLLSQGGVAAISAATNANYLSLETSGSYVQIVSGKSGSAVFFPLVLNVNGAEVARFATNGCFGINTASPTRPLHITKASVGETILTTVSGGSTFTISNQSLYTRIGTTNSTSFRIAVGGVDVLSVDDSTKNIGIGTLTPSHPLHIKYVADNSLLLLDGTGLSGAVTITFDIHAGTDIGSIVCSKTLYLGTASAVNAVQISDTGVLSAGITNVSHFTAIGDCLLATNVFPARTVRIGPGASTGELLNVGGNVSIEADLAVSTNITALGSAFVAFLGVGANPIAASSIAEFASTTKGVLFPRMTTAQKNAISSPVAGLVIYDTTLNKLCVRVAAAWETITSA